MMKLLAILADCQPHSFENLTALLGLDDEQLLVQITLLQQQGIHVDISFGDVRLLPKTALLQIEKLRQAFPLHKIIYHPIIHSTNQFLLENIGRLDKGDMCLTEHQTAGRGRRGRQWQSPFASLAMFSLVWQVDASKPIDGLSLVVGMAIIDALHKLGVEDVKLKWPNDLLLNGRKLAGILIEIANTESGMMNLVIGVGMNVAVTKEQNQIDQPWANLTEILPKIDRTRLLISMINELYSALELFELHGINEDFQQKWQQYDAFLGEQVFIISDKQWIAGIEQGIDERGYLRLLTDNGAVFFNAGEVSLRRKN